MCVMSIADWMHSFNWVIRGCQSLIIGFEEGSVSNELVNQTGGLQCVCLTGDKMC